MMQEEQPRIQPGLTPRRPTTPKWIASQERANALKDKHAFKTELDDEARRHMFPQNARLAS